MNRSDILCLEMDGVFVCRRCGQCCRGQGGIVVGMEEQERISAYLGLSIKDFCGQYTVVQGKKRLIGVDDAGQCLLLGPKGCLVHPAKPDVCRAWPFFRGNLLDEESWRMAQDACPGLVKTAGFAEFVRVGLAYMRSRNLGQSGRNAANALKIDDITFPDGAAHGVRPDEEK